MIKANPWGTHLLVMEAWRGGRGGGGRAGGPLGGWEFGLRVKEADGGRLQLSISDL